MNIQEAVMSYQQDILDNLAKLVSYNSVQGKAEENAPFGQGPKAVLEEALKMCESYGFKTKNLDNYCGYAEIGEGDQTIGVIGHLDIVPAGEGWDTDPFTATIKEGKMYGRGTSDDKGAVVASMIALKIIQDMNIPLNKKIRLIMGCNEETGSKCLEHYVEKEGHIDMGFTPDGNFPGVYGEKGMVSATFSSKETSIKDIHGGVASNVVCNHCVCVVEKNNFSQKTLEDYFNNNNIEYTITEQDGNVVLDVKGVAAHASMPDLGVNAISHTLVGLKESGFQDPFVNFYVSHIGLETNGAMLGADLKDEYGALTLNNGVISMENGVITGTIDIRFPVTMSAKNVLKCMKDHLEDDGGIITINRTGEPLFFPPDSPMVSKLVAAYREVTGDTETEPMTMGGGTYAKGIHNCIAFGCEFLGDDNHIHDANEFVKIDQLYLQAQIYVVAILKLLED